MLNNSKSSRIMPGTSNSSVKSGQPKATNVFYIWYAELCRRSNINPCVSKKGNKPKCETVLDFNADRLTVDDWIPLINALRLDTSLHVISISNEKKTDYDFLHDVDNERKARLTKRRYGLISTDFVLNSLVQALSYSLKRTQVLTALELDGIPLFNMYLDVLLKAMKGNNTLKILSLVNCSIQDDGCRSVCLSLQRMPNVESLNLSRSDLTSVSGSYIAKLIKFQQLNRYTASWHRSLRYSDPDTETMRGIRRITLNGNTKLGDVGLNYILDELEDDLWIKALDVQRCGITENIAPKLLDILAHNQSIQVADFRQNKDLNPSTHQKIFDLLQAKASIDDSSLYWCSTLLTLNPSKSSTFRGNTTSASTKTSIVARKSVHAIVNTNKKVNGIANNIKKINGFVKDSQVECTTLNKINKKMNGYVEDKLLETSTKGKRIHLNFEIKHEVIRGDFRNQNTKICRRPIINKKINGINSIHTVNEVGNRVMSSLKNLQVPKDLPNNIVTDLTIKEKKSSKYRNGINVTVNGVTNGCVFDNNSARDVIQSLFGGNQVEKAKDYSDADIVDRESQNYATDLSEIRQNSSQFLRRDEISSSQISLFKYMEEYEDPKNFPYHVKGKKNGIK
ncbi:hypothetical protein WA026_000934 [Henosepilachna vigintioctopunctata]|uniref:Centrosomal protein of 78 kDa n=1 Tax=Henosepilachna vigintioctopunctata TaxID=420089 RepID=A0AAW1V5G1_9CUCU